MHILFILFAAVAAEVAGTSFLQQSGQFTRPVPTVLMAICYGVSLWLLSLTLKVVPLGIAYAIWSGFGIVLVSMIGLFIFGQRLDLPAIIGLALIVAGVVVVNLFSKSTPH